MTIPKTPRHRLSRRPSLSWSLGGLIAVSLFLGLLGCATCPPSDDWGSRVVLQPGWDRVGAAARDAILDPRTWIPAAGALLLRIDDLDADAADWAARRTPLWGSNGDAGRGSDRLLAASQAAYWLTALATPSGEDPRCWVANKGKGVAIGMIAVGVNHEITEFTKDRTARARPDRSDTRSLPSGHASQASVYASLAGRNARAIQTDQRIRFGIETISAALAVGCAWSRVEARKHYPSDALAGLALGHLLAAFFDGAFLRGVRGEGLAIGVDPIGPGAGFRVEVRLP